MEAAAGLTAAHGVSLSMPSPQSSRKESLADSEHPVRNSPNEQTADVDFCSITRDGSLDNDILQQRIHTVLKRRQELQRIETELRAQLIARSEIMGLQSTYDSQIKEHVNANVKLQEQLREKQLTINELGRKIEDARRELHAIRLESEAIWAKDDLLREQNKELATFRRERDNTEAEIAQHVKQIHELQEHFQEKELQFVELQEQHRVAQETVIFKDDQLREAQAWITRVQEMDALQKSTIQTLQAELRDHTEQYNQLWLGCHGQFAELVHMIQHQQIELADARERSGSYSAESCASQTQSKDASQFGQSDGSDLDVSGNDKNGALPNGTAENNPSFVSNGNASGQVLLTNHVPVAPHSLLGMPTYLASGQGTATMHPFVMHQQVVSNSVPSHVPHLQLWQNQQAVSEGLQMPMQSQYEVSGNGQAFHPEYMEAHIGQGLEPHVMVPSSNEGGGQILESIDKSYMVDPQPQHNLQQLSSRLQDALKLAPLDQNSETEEKNVNTLANHGVVDAQRSMIEQPISPAIISKALINPVYFTEITTTNNAGVTLPPEAFVSSAQKTTSPAAGNSSEITALLDIGSLLGCIVRTIPPNGRIRISSTLPNRLGKMLAPLDWHDYKKNYGKLDDFVAGHPELFLIDGDYIQLREGAQETIAATAAFAKVKAAASATSLYSSLLPSVAVTPMVQSHRLRKENPNGVSFALGGGGVSTVQILSKHKDHLVEFNGHESSRPGQSALHLNTGNGASIDRSDVVGSQSRGSTQGRTSANFYVKQQSRRSGTSSSSRR